METGLVALCSNDISHSSIYKSPYLAFVIHKVCNYTLPNATDCIIFLLPYTLHVWQHWKIWNGLPVLYHEGWEFQRLQIWHSRFQDSKICRQQYPVISFTNIELCFTCTSKIWRQYHILNRRIQNMLSCARSSMKRLTFYLPLSCLQLSSFSKGNSSYTAVFPVPVLYFHSWVNSHKLWKMLQAVAVAPNHGSKILSLHVYWCWFHICPHFTTYLLPLDLKWTTVAFIPDTMRSQFIHGNSLNFHT